MRSNARCAAWFGLFLVVFLVQFTPARAAALTPKKKVLVVLSSSDVVTLQGGKKHPTGYFLSELVVPLREIVKQGYSVVVATPEGKVPAMDAASDQVQYFKSAQEYTEMKAFRDTLEGLKRPEPLSRLTDDDLKQFDGIFIPGGHAPLEDLATDADVGRILGVFHAAHKPTASICHGPAALLAATSADGRWIYDGYRMVAFSTGEEKIAEAGNLGGRVRWYLDQALKQKGADIPKMKAWEARSVWDRELVTGQNPMSDRELTRNFLMALAEYDLSRASGTDPYRAGQKRLRPDRVYQVIPFPDRWREGYTNIYIGARRGSVQPRGLLERLASHVGHVKQVFQPAGLQGYLVLSDGNGEIALMNWKTRKDADAAGSAPGRDAVIEESAQFLDSLVLSEVPGANDLKLPALP